MRAVFIGAGSIATMTARILLRRGHEVVIIEKNKERIEALSEHLDCGFLHGDGSTPAILREADPEHTDALFCLAGNDQTNIIASLVGRSLGFARVITRIADLEFEHICIELGLDDTIIPSRTIGRYLADSFQGLNLLELSGMIKDEARMFSFVAHGLDQKSVSEIDFPAQTRMVCLYREGKFVPVDGDTKVRDGDEIVVITHSKHLAALHERWGTTAERPR